MVASMKATWWSITVFNESELYDVQHSNKFPLWVRAIYGGLEKCPETGKIHFQGALQAHRQVRFTQVKDWLPTTHIEPAKDVKSLKQYAMKTETAVGEKKVVNNMTTMTTICQRIADTSFDFFCQNVLAKNTRLINKMNGHEFGVDEWNNSSFRDGSKIWNEFDPEWYDFPKLANGAGKYFQNSHILDCYWFAVNKIIRADPDSAASFANPALPKFFSCTYLSWYFPIDQTDRQTDSPPPENEIILEEGASHAPPPPEVIVLPEGGTPPAERSDAPNP